MSPSSRRRAIAAGSSPPASAARCSRSTEPSGEQTMSDDPVHLIVNGVARSARVPALTTLQRLLHHALGHRDVKLGCGEGVCGACTVVVDGAPVPSCLQLAAQCDGATVITAAGLARDPAHADAAERLRAQLVAREAFQCGYCAPGMMASAACYL